MADDQTICRLPYKGEDYPLHPRDITVSKLRQMQSWYGERYGTYSTFLSLFFQGDANAVACALWIVLAKSGINRTPQNIDYSPYDVYEAINKANEEKEAEQAKSAEGDDADPLAAEDPDLVDQSATIHDGAET